MEFKPEIKAIDISNVQDLKNVVVSVHYICTATKIVGEKSYTRFAFDVVYLPLPNPDKFIDLDKIDEKIVWSWLNLDLDKIKSVLSTQIDLEINPIIKTIFNPFDKNEN